MQFRGVTSLKFWGRQKFEGAKCLILGEQQYFVWDAASQDTKWLAVLNILVEHGLLPPLATPVVQFYHFTREYTIVISCEALPWFCWIRIGFKHLQPTRKPWTRDRSTLCFTENQSRTSDKS